VLVDGKATLSCTTPLKQVEGKQITTIEGLAGNGKLHPLQQAFIELDAMQCGYCTPGMIMAAAALLARNPNPSDKQIAEWLERHVCRCGVYQRIIAATRLAADRIRGGAR